MGRKDSGTHHVMPFCGGPLTMVESENWDKPVQRDPGDHLTNLWYIFGFTRAQAFQTGPRFLIFICIWQIYQLTSILTAEWEEESCWNLHRSICICEARTEKRRVRLWKLQTSRVCNICSLCCLQTRKSPEKLTSVHIVLFMKQKRHGFPQPSKWNCSCGKIL